MRLATAPGLVFSGYIYHFRVGSFELLARSAVSSILARFVPRQPSRYRLPGLKTQVGRFGDFLCHFRGNYFASDDAAVL